MAGWTPTDANDFHSRNYPQRTLANRLPQRYRMFGYLLLDRLDYELEAKYATWVNRLMNLPYWKI